MIFNNEKEMRSWVIEKVGTGYTGHGPAAAEIIHKLKNRPPYGTDWSAFISTLPYDLEHLVYEKIHQAKPKKDFIALVQMENKKNQVLGIMSERDKNDCFLKVYDAFPQLVKYQSVVLIKTKSELTAGEKKQLENLK